MYVSDGNISVGYEIFADIRKKPCIVVRQGNECYILGTFKNNDDAVFFVDKLAELTSTKELEELKANRIALEKANGYLEANHRLGYNKAIDDIKEKLMQNGFIYTQHALDVFNEISEQLKAGNSNGS